MKILCVGLGSIGKQVANTLSQSGYDVTGISRSYKTNLYALVNQLIADVLAADFAQKINSLQTYWDRVIITLTPDEYSEQGYQTAYLETAKHITTALGNWLTDDARVIFISSTGVYGENAGEICDETTQVKPTRARSQYIYDAENYYADNFEHVTVIRPSGIYGLKRLRLVNMLDSNKTISAQHWSNRIFDTDLVNIICHITELAKVKPVYLATDTVPVYQAEVLDYLAEKLDKPKLARLPTADITGKQLKSINLPSNWLSYPTWREGYDVIIRNYE